MQNYWKSIGAGLGGVLGILAAVGLVPAEVASPAVQSSLIGVVTAIGGVLGAFFAPKNVPPA